MLILAGVVISNLAMIAGFPVENDNSGINIVGGSETTPHEYPFIAAIQRYGGNTTYQWCGACILNSSWILTAAHCITAIDTSESFLIVAGDHDVSIEEGTEQRRSVARIIQHTNFSTLTYANDIALMQVTPPFELNSYVQPLVLSKRKLLNTEDNAVAMGWGRLRPEGTLPIKLMHVTLPLVDTAVCKSAYGQDAILESMICAGEELGGKDTCRGDTGGPLILSDNNDGRTAIGISSWGLGCGSPGFPGVYTNVGFYTDWIMGNMKN